MGTANMTAPITRQKVPTMAGNIPPSRIPLVGALVKNSQSIAPIPFLIIIKTISPTGITTNKVERKRKKKAIF
jgi:hypothetical protein